MSEENTYHSPWDDPNVKDALKERQPRDISLICCENCGSFSYYNEGSSWSCQWCEHSASGRSLDRLIDDGEVITLDEYSDMLAEEFDVP